MKTICKGGEIDFDKLNRFDPDGKGPFCGVMVAGYGQDLPISERGTFLLTSDQGRIRFADLAFKLVLDAGIRTGSPMMKYLLAETERSCVVHSDGIRALAPVLVNSPALALLSEMDVSAVTLPDMGLCVPHNFGALRDGDMIGAMARVQGRGPLVAEYLDGYLWMDDRTRTFCGLCRGMSNLLRTMYVDDIRILVEGLYRTLDMPVAPMVRIPDLSETGSAAAALAQDSTASLDGAGPEQTGPGDEETGIDDAPAEACMDTACGVQAEPDVTDGAGCDAPSDAGAADGTGMDQDGDVAEEDDTGSEDVGQAGDGGSLEDAVSDVEDAVPEVTDESEDSLSGDEEIQLGADGGNDPEAPETAGAQDEGLSEASGDADGEESGGDGDPDAGGGEPAADDVPDGCAPVTAIPGSSPESELRARFDSGQIKAKGIPASAITGMDESYSHGYFEQGYNRELNIRDSEGLFEGVLKSRLNGTPSPVDVLSETISQQTGRGGVAGQLRSKMEDIREELGERVDEDGGLQEL